MTEYADGDCTRSVGKISNKIRAYREDNDSIQSPVWIWFTSIDGDRATCLLCEKVLQNYGSTSNLSQHLKRSHDANTKHDAWIICQELMELKQERIASKKRSHLQAYEAEKRPSDINENPTAAEADKNLANCPEEISKGICAYRKDSNATHSPMWIWFSRIKQNQVICLLCHKTLHKQENNTSTCNLSQHMKKWHDAKSEFDAWIICQELIELKLQRHVWRFTPATIFFLEN